MKKHLIISALLLIITVIFFCQHLLNNDLNNNSYLAILVDGKPVTTAPDKGNYEVNVSCTGATGSWDYDLWQAVITNIKDTAKCNLIFTSANPVNLATYIKSLSSNDDVYNEPSGDWRYEGKNPNNYVWFNNELWRMIGVFSDYTHERTGESLVKIIRDTPLGGLVWDKADNGNWTAASLYPLLNTYYYNGTNEPSPNYCYGYGTAIPGNCDFTITGIINSTYRSMIENVTWRLGGSPDMNRRAESIYFDERFGGVLSGRPAKIKNYIGLMYPTDFAYSVTAASCVRTTLLSVYGTSACSGSAWLRGQAHEWTLTSERAKAQSVYYIYNNGDIGSAFASGSLNIRPTLYLKAGVKKITGDGTPTNPYIISS